MIDQPSFLYRAMDLIAQAELHDEVWWHTTGGTVAPTLVVKCSDIFAWGCADCEPITPENIHYLEAAIRECLALPGFAGVGYIGQLFCAKARGLRPQGAAYPKAPEVAALFDACGPKREVNFGNPYAHPEDGGGYEYRKK